MCPVLFVHLAPAPSLHMCVPQSFTASPFQTCAVCVRRAEKEAAAGQLSEMQQTLTTHVMANRDATVALTARLEETGL